jgi:hypothetical protein
MRQVWISKTGRMVEELGPTAGFAQSPAARNPTKSGSRGSS